MGERKEHPSVDVVIATTGRASLAQAILAGLSQTWPNTRTVVIADGPSESARMIFDAHAPLGDAHALYVELPAKMGRGNLVREWWLQSPACAEFVKPLDDDDWIPPVCVEAMMAPMKEAAVNVTLCDIVVLFAPGNRLMRSAHRPARLAVGVGSGQSLIRSAAAREVKYLDVPDGDYHWLAKIAQRGECRTVNHPLYIYNAYRTNVEREPFRDA